MTMVDVITEEHLDEFRTTYLHPAALHEKLLREDAALLVSVPPGAGKTHAAHGLVPYALDHGHDLVVFVTPTRALVREFQDSSSIDPIADRMVVLEPRPRDRCGSLNKEWEAHESASCVALAKSTLCETCPHFTASMPCRWPAQMEQIGAVTKVVVVTEQNLALKPLLLQDITSRAEAKKPLVIFDEATFVGKSEVRRFSRDELVNFRSVLASVHQEQGGRTHLQAWIEQIDDLLSDSDSLYSARFSSYAVVSNVLAIQTAGQVRHGRQFRYLAHELSLLQGPATTGRWVRDDLFEITTGIDTRGYDVAVFAPYLRQEVVSERLGRKVVDALPEVVLRHTGTRIANIADSVGSMRSLSVGEHFTRVVDFFLAHLLRDKLVGRRSVVVAKKSLVPKIRERVETQSRALGRPLRCAVGIVDGSEDIDVALINYGALGINAFKDFDALYCIGSYNARGDHVSNIYGQVLPPERRHEFGIRTRDGIRTLVGLGGTLDARYHAGLAGPTFEMLERRVVLQAVGRVRPFTSPADVILFQADDFSRELGDVETHRTLGMARSAWGVPLLSQMQTASLGDRMRPMRQAGSSFAAIAEAFGVSKSTAHKALSAPTMDDCQSAPNFDPLLECAPRSGQVGRV